MKNNNKVKARTYEIIRGNNVNIYSTDPYVNTYETTIELSEDELHELSQESINIELCANFIGAEPKLVCRVTPDKIEHFETAIEKFNKVISRSKRIFINYEVVLHSKHLPIFVKYDDFARVMEIGQWARERN